MNCIEVVLDEEYIMLALSENVLLFVAFNEIQHIKQTGWSHLLNIIKPWWGVYITVALSSISIIRCINEIQPMKQTGRPLLLNLVSQKKTLYTPFFASQYPPRENAFALRARDHINPW